MTVCIVARDARIRNPFATIVRPAMLRLRTVAEFRGAAQLTRAPMRKSACRTEAAVPSRARHGRAKRRRNQASLLPLRIAAPPNVNAQKAAAYRDVQVTPAPLVLHAAHRAEVRPAPPGVRQARAALLPAFRAPAGRRAVALRKVRRAAAARAVTIRAAAPIVVPKTSQ